MSRLGKIARLPHSLRDQVNHKLLDALPGRQIVDWLNEMPAVREILARHFDGRPISEQNLAEWKQGGFRLWFAQEDARMSAFVLAADARELTKVVGGSVADHLATVIAAKYAVAIAAWDGRPDPDLDRTLRTLAEISRSLEEIRRGDHSAARVRQDQARITLEGARAEKNIIERFREWITLQGGWKQVFDGEGLTQDQQFQRFYKLLTGEEPPSEPQPESEAEFPPRELTPPP